MKQSDDKRYKNSRSLVLRWQFWLQVWTSAVLQISIEEDFHDVKSCLDSPASKSDSTSELLIFSKIVKCNGKPRLLKSFTEYLRPAFWIHEWFSCGRSSTVQLFHLIITFSEVDSTPLFASSERHRKAFDILPHSFCLSKSLNSFTVCFPFNFLNRTWSALASTKRSLNLPLIHRSSLLDNVFAIEASFSIFGPCEK